MSRHEAFRAEAVNFVGKDPLSITGRLVNEIAIVTIIQDGGSLMLCHQMTPDQARYMADALHEAADFAELELGRVVA